jgi:hypothetical protein
MAITSLIPGIAAGAAWLAVCCVIIGKWIKNGKAALIVVAVILFIVFTGVFVGVRIGAAVGAEALQKNAVLVEEYLAKNHSDIRLVRSGVDVSALPQAIDEMEAIIPRRISEFGLSGIITDNLYQNALSRSFNVIRTRTDRIAGYAEDGIVTSSTIIRALEWEVNSLIQKIVFYCTLVQAITMAVYLVICVIAALSARKKAVTAK